MTKPFMCLLCLLFVLLPLPPSLSSLILLAVYASSFFPLTCTLCCLIVPLLSLFASLSFFALFALLSRLFFTPLTPAFSSSSYIIFSLSTSPPPSPHPFYFIPSHDLHSARHFSYFSALPAFLSMLSSSLPLSLIYLNASPQLFF